MKKTSWSKRASAIVFITVSVLAISLGIHQLLGIYDGSEKLLPPLPTHSVARNSPQMLWSDSLKVSLPSDLSTPKVSICSAPGSNWIEGENLNPGSDMTAQKWRNLHVYIAKGAVLWLNKLSADCGDTIQIHASMYNTDQSDTSPRYFEVMRIGYYAGAGSRVMWRSDNLSIRRYKIQQVKNLTRTVETNWPTLTSFTIGKDWKPGFYIVASRNQDGNIENFSPLIIRGESAHSKLLLIHSALTWQAYNRFGGRSAYYGPIDPIRERSRVVSFDRPFTGSGINHIDRDAIALVQWLEEEGISYDQISDIDLNRTPSIIKKYNGIILSGHPEYMTNREFKTIMAARNNGINVAILGANSAYWQVRTDSSQYGPERKVDIYRNAAQDPVRNPDLVSTQFHNPIINMRPSLITGEETAGVHVHGDMNLIEKPDWLNLDQSAVLRNWPGNSEIDSQAGGKFAPEKSHILFSGKMSLFAAPKAKPRVKTDRNYKAQTIWFTTPSGSAVFVAGINYWACELSYSCMEGNVDETTRAILQDVTRQVLQLWSERGIGKKLQTTTH